MREDYAQLLDNATTLWSERKGWFPFKWATVGILRAAARNPEWQRKMVNRFGDDPTPVPPPPPPTLRDLIVMAFEFVLIVYGPSLPFGGYWVRAARDFVLQYLDLLVVPRTMRVIR